jgi:hypothetical protein
MKQHQIPLPPDPVPDSAQKKAPQTAPTVKRGEHSSCDLLELCRPSAPTEENAQGQSKPTGPHCDPKKGRRLQSPRQRRALVALLTGPKPREQIDRVAGASNSPDVIGRMRRRFGLTLPCQLERVKDQDGRSVERGVYRLTDQDATKARDLLEGGSV